MATVSKWTPFGVALDITATGGTVTRTSATKFTVKITASWETYYSGAQTNYGMTASSGGSSVNLNTFGVKASSGKGTFTGSYSISGNGSATKSVTVTFKNFNDDNGNSATKTVTFDVTVPAWTSYTVTYNANGGTGAPGKQTKWKDQTLILSTTKPTRSGYTFVGWGTSTSDTSVDYSAGGSYTSNSAITLYAIWKKTIELTYNANGGTGIPSKQTATVYNATTKYTFTVSSTKPTRAGHTFLGWSTSASATSSTHQPGDKITLSSSDILYAVWKINTYTISYDANGGTGAPGNQTKIYGTTLSISSVIPTRTNYDFLGWATSPTATTPIYQAGGSYTNNYATTLYAIWELSYVRPRISNVVVKRCSFDEDDSNYIDNELGEYISVEFNYNCDRSISKSVITWSSPSFTNSHTYNFENGDNSGYIIFIIRDAPVSNLDINYSITIMVEDTEGYSEKHISLPGTKFAIDVMPENKGIAFGGPAETQGVAEFKTYAVKPSSGYINIQLPNSGDLNEIVQVNTYIGSNIVHWNNKPTGLYYTSDSFTLEVTGAGTIGQVKQTLTVCHPTDFRAYVRFLCPNTQGVWVWSEWAEIYSHTGKILGISGHYMTPDHNFTLSEPISKQKNGVVFVFSGFDTDTNSGIDGNFSCHFIPKQVISMHDGCYHNFIMSSANFGYIATKTLIIYDNLIQGTLYNNSSGTVSGITYNNKRFILRYVIGV